MILVKILKRKDASSVLVAIILAMIIQQPIVSMTGKPASIISGLSGPQYGFNYGPGSGWQGEYLFPIVWALLEIVVLEVLVWIFIFLAMPFKKRK
ncbi:MAG TPA: hypothetical protein VFB03_00705 [Candidatus Saccharimonadales bacterium]|nr:hypothetical protein [Candidatus Saccharimonadales bacterium]